MQHLALHGQGFFGALAGCGGGLFKHLGRHTKFVGGRLQPCGRAFHAQRKRCSQVLRAARLQGAGGVGQKGLGQQITGVRADHRHGLAVAWWEEVDLQTHAIKQAAHLVFDHVGQGAHHHQGGCGVGAGGQAGDHGRKTGVFALGEGGFDATARVVEHAHLGVVDLVLPFGRTRQVELDDFRGARTHQEQQADVGAARQQLADHAVELFVHIGQARQIAFVDDGGAKAGLGKNHHARGRLDQVGTGA